MREFQLPSGSCDYLLFIGDKAAGVIETRQSGIMLSGVADQSDKYMNSLPDHPAHWDDLDDSLEDIDSLPALDVIAGEIVENLEAALDQFRSVTEELVE